MFSAGVLAAADEGDDEITLHDGARGLYKKLTLRGDQIVGSVLYGHVADASWYVELMRGKIDVSAFRDQLVFGRAYAEHARGQPISSDPGDRKAERPHASAA